MPIFDVILLIFLCGFVFYGLFFGLIKTFGSFVGLIGGALIATHFYQLAAEFVGQYFPAIGSLKIIIFFAIFIIVNRLIVIIFSLVNKAYDLISIIPFLKSINRLAGAIFGLAEGIFIIALILYIIRNSFLNSWVGHLMSSSTISPYVLSAIKTFNNYFPNFFDKLISLF
jgi:membrane protein required for colicin V production